MENEGVIQIKEEMLRVAIQECLKGRDYFEVEIIEEDLVTDIKTFSIPNTGLKSEIFALANKLAKQGYGKAAVEMHRIYSSLI